MHRSSRVRKTNWIGKDPIQEMGFVTDREIIGVRHDLDMTRQWTCVGEFQDMSARRGRIIREGDELL